MSKIETKKLHYIVAYYIEGWGYDTTNVFVEKMEDIEAEIEGCFNKSNPKIIILGAVLSDIYEPSMFTDKKLIALVDKIDPDWVAKKA